ncbi:uncharacterized protein L199_003746 [Kwoniella botswanensis]|uniref:uncharacterized protein n=1 Tax=Kwoniella botswanensis TaxID=1268659 RepID=UPI00315DA744
MPQTTTSSATPTIDLKMRVRKIKASELPVRKRRRVSSEPGEETVAFVGVGDPLQMSNDDGHRAASESENRSVLGKLNSAGSGSKCESKNGSENESDSDSEVGIFYKRLGEKLVHYALKYDKRQLREENETLKEELDSKKKELEEEKEKVEELSEKLNEEKEISSAGKEEYTRMRDDLDKFMEAYNSKYVWLLTELRKRQKQLGEKSYTSKQVTELIEAASKERKAAGRDQTK